MDCTLSKQLLAADWVITNVSTDHFQPQTCLAFAFQFERTANLNRICSQSVNVGFWCKFSA